MTAQIDAKAGIFSLAVIVSALGYLVDIYDIVLFGLVRTASLEAIGLSGEDLFTKGVLLLNIQMAGMLIGGVVWGMLGDKQGRLSVLFGSILLYSLANIANAFVTNIEQYAILRFIAGVGLAGEIGGAITLVSESMDRHRRGYGATVIASVGFLGAVIAGLVANIFDWRTAYIVGGVLGLLLLILRMNVLESGMFTLVQKRTDIVRGNFLMLLWPPRRLLTYLCCILIGVPIIYSVMIFAYFAPELAANLGATGPVSATNSLMLFYGALTPGGIACGLLGERLKTRRLTYLIFFVISMMGGLAYLRAPEGLPPEYFYAISAFIGFATGYVTLFFVMSAEQFGTNIRATASTSVANFMRAATIPITSGYIALKAHMPLADGALLIGAICFGIAIPALFYLKETYSRDLDFIES